MFIFHIVQSQRIFFQPICLAHVSHLIFPSLLVRKSSTISHIKRFANFSMAAHCFIWLSRDLWRFVVFSFRWRRIETVLLGHFFVLYVFFSDDEGKLHARFINGRTIQDVLFKYSNINHCYIWIIWRIWSASEMVCLISYCKLS